MSMDIGINKHHELEITSQDRAFRIEVLRNLDGAVVLSWNNTIIAPPTDGNADVLRGLAAQYAVPGKINLDPKRGGIKPNWVIERFLSRRYYASMDIEPPEPVEVQGLRKKLLPHQEAGVWYAARVRRCWIADDCGLGKTPIALATVQLRRDFPLLVVCPAALMQFWADEIHKWLGRTAEVITGEDTFARNRSVYLANYKTLTTLPPDQWQWTKPSAIIFDEAHWLKDEDSQQSQAAYRISKGVYTLLLVTSTPVINHPGELIMPLRIMRHYNQADHLRKFVESFDAARDKWKCFDELYAFQAELRQTCLLRRSQHQLARDTPPPEIAYRLMELPIPISDYLTNQAFGHVIGPESGSERPAGWQPVRSPIQVTGLLKAPGIIDFVRQLSADKVVVFAQHTRVLKYLARNLDAILLEGGTESIKIRDALARFQSDPNQRVLVMSYGIADGWSLNGVQHMLIAELPWSPADVYRAISRLYRLGQKGQVKVYIMRALKTPDAKYIRSAYEIKEQIIEYAVNIDPEEYGSRKRK